MKFLLALLCTLFVTLSFSQETRILRTPDISANHITFVYANDIWLADHQGKNVKRLTSFFGGEFDPFFSPDGKTIAFTGEYDGNFDVYTVPVTGGEPERLTWHPGFDQVKGWTPDGSAVVFHSARESAPTGSMAKFYTIGLKDAFPKALPLPRVTRGDISPDGKSIVYQKINPWESEFRNYRGGQCNPIRIADLQSLAVTELPWNGANDINPVYVGKDIYYLTDRDFSMNVWSYDAVSKTVKQVTTFRDFDCKNLASGAGHLIFENGGYLYTMKPGTDSSPRKITIKVDADFEWARPFWEDVNDEINEAGISPSGKRALFSARGEVFTVPAKDGDIRNLSNDSGASDIAPAWSPDGKSISWFSDASGEYQLVISDQFGDNKREIKINSPTYPYTPAWSPDSKYLAYTSTDRTLRIVNVTSGEQWDVANEGFTVPERTIYPEWSPDSKWITYTKRFSNEYNGIFIYSLDQKKSYPISNELANCTHPAWDASGKYIYFECSTNYGLNVGWLDMHSYEHEAEYAIYMAVLAKATAHPLFPKSDDEEAEEEEPEEKSEEEEKSSDVVIDLDGLQNRVIALDIPKRSYVDIKAGKEGVFYYLESVRNEQGLKLHEYKLEDLKSKEIASGIGGIEISADGEKMLIQSGGSNFAIESAGSKPEEGALSLSGMKMKVDPAKEWAQIFREAWRYQRDYFYVENVHGADLDWIWEKYSPWLKDVRHRSDMNYLLDILGGETSVGHSFVGGGDMPDVDRVPMGLLGADYKIENGHYRIAKIYNGESWNPDVKAPLSGPGIDVSAGDYIISVNGEPVTSSTNFYKLFEQTAGKVVTLVVNSSASKVGARTVKVVPVSNENALRRMDWVESNRRKVDEMSNGQLAYVWLPNTGGGGYEYFNRYFFAQKNKKGAVIDERFNGGGSAADYIVDMLDRELMGYFNNPIGDNQPFTSPGAGIYGPKVMIINEMAGSGGDLLPYMFKKREVGPLVGTKTWGGLVGIWDVPGLLDGGRMTAPRGGFFNTEGEWDVENIGIAPDIVVEQDPAQMAKGIDPQLARAVQVCMDLLDKESVKLKSQPKDPVRAKRPGRS